jgi:hypothetical protein
MQLARAAAARALADRSETEQSPPAEPPCPAAAEPQIAPTNEPPAERETAPAAPPRRAAFYPARTAAKPVDPAVLFTRLAAVVRDCIALEARLAAAPTETTTNRALQLRADPRRTLLREAFRLTTENHPDRAALTRDIATRLDEDLAADPDRAIDPVHLFEALADEFGIDIDYAILPDEFIFGADETADEDEDVPEPRATSPP